MAGLTCSSEELRRDLSLVERRNVGHDRLGFTVTPPRYQPPHTFRHQPAQKGGWIHGSNKDIINIRGHQLTVHKLAQILNFVAIITRYLREGCHSISIRINTNVLIFVVVLYQMYDTFDRGKA